MNLEETKKNKSEPLDQRSNGYQRENERKGEGKLWEYSHPFFIP